MKYLCLRNCFVNGQIYLKGEVHELPDSMRESTKFQPLGQPVEVEPEPEPKSEPVKPDKIPAGMFWCAKCKILHRESSKKGQKHLKHKEEE